VLQLLLLLVAFAAASLVLVLLKRCIDNPLIRR